MSPRLSVAGIGMVTAVGLSAPAACAAMRGKLDGFCETAFHGPGDDWLIGAPVPLPRGWIGEKRLAHLAAGAIVEAFEGAPQARGHTALILCLPEEGRPGRPVADGERLARMIAEITGVAPRTQTHLVAYGRPSGFVALTQARRILERGQADYVMIAGVDSYLTGGAIRHYLGEDRILTADTANGFIPGEAAAAVLLAPGDAGPLVMAGLGLAREEAYLYNAKGEDGLDRPLRGDGMTRAYAQALDEAGTTLAKVDYRISDLIGEQYFFKQAALTTLRLERGRKEFQDLWSPAEHLGNIGAAVVPAMIGMAAMAAVKRYSGGSPLLIEASADDGACGAAVFYERAA